MNVWSKVTCPTFPTDRRYDKIIIRLQFLARLMPCYDYLFFNHFRLSLLFM